MVHRRGDKKSIGVEVESSIRDYGPITAKEISIHTGFETKTISSWCRNHANVTWKYRIEKGLAGQRKKKEYTWRE